MSACNFTQSIPATQCIGDSLVTINSNFDNLDTNLCNLRTTVNTVSSNLNNLTTVVNNIPQTFCYIFSTFISNPQGFWGSESPSESGGFSFSLPGINSFYTIADGTRLNEINDIQDVNFLITRPSNVFLKVMSYWNQNGPNTYQTSPVMTRISFDYSVNNGASWLRPDSFVKFTYNVNGGINSGGLIPTAPVINAGGCLAGGVSTVMSAGQTIKFRPKWKVSPLPGEENTTRVTTMGGSGIFEVTIQPI
jgi:hypothetical protein